MSDQETLDNVPPKQGKWPDCNQVDSDGKWSHRQPLIRSLADVKRIVELRNAKAELEKERDSWRRVSEKLEEQKVNLISSGTKISNLAYNLKQDAELPKFVRNSLESSQKEWDETVSISKALKVGE
jgi:hypothetical protein